MAAGYSIRLTPHAESDLFKKVPETIRHHVAESIELLAENPLERSRKALPPAEFPGYLIHTVPPIVFDDAEYHIKVFFHFSQDEKSLIIKRFGVVRYERRDW